MKVLIFESVDAPLDLASRMPVRIEVPIVPREEICQVIYLI